MIIFAGFLIILEVRLFDSICENSYSLSAMSEKIGIPIPPSLVVVTLVFFLCLNKLSHLLLQERIRWGLLHLVI